MMMQLVLLCNTRKTNEWLVFCLTCTERVFRLEIMPALTNKSP
jgi:hypothetical protein